MEWGGSTHRAAWVLPAGEAEARRARARAAARAAGAGPGPALEPAEESALARHYEGLIAQVGARLGLPEAVRQVGAVFFKRFYLAHSAMDFDPGRMALTALYLAGKVENHYVPAEDLGQCAGRDAKAVLGGEIAMLEALRFHIAVHAPCRALGGFLHAFEAFAEGGPPGGASGGGGGAARGEGGEGAAPAGLAELDRAARGALRALMATDAPLRFAPARLAVAALRSAGRSVREPRVKEFLDAELTKAAQAAGPVGGEAELRRGLEEELGEIDRLGAESAERPATALEELQRIDVKLRKCRNPLYDPARKKKREGGKNPPPARGEGAPPAAAAGPSDAPGAQPTEGVAGAAPRAEADGAGGGGTEEGAEGRRGSLKRAGPGSPEEGGEGAKRRKSGPDGGDGMGG